MRKTTVAALALLALSGSAHAATYYNCATPSGTNLSDLADGSTCTVPIATWNATPVNTHQLRVRAGTTFSIGSETINAAVLVFGAFVQEGDGTVLSFDGNFVTFGGASFTSSDGSSQTTNFNNVVNVSSNSTLNWSGDNRTININGEFVTFVFSTINANGSGASQLNIAGSFRGAAGSLASSATTTFSGAGTINGATPASVDALPSPVNLEYVGRHWDGSAWSPAAPSSVNHRAVFSGNYSSSANPPFTAGYLTVTAGAVATFDNNLNLKNLASFVRNDGTIVLVDDTVVGTSFGPIFSPGNIILRRTVNLPSNAYLRMGFPVGAGPTYNDVTFNNFPKASTFFWNAGNSTWTAAASGTTLSANALAVYGKAGSNRSVQVQVTSNQFTNNNASAKTFNIAYHDPGAASGFIGATDGWNQLYNPFSDFVSSQAVVNLMDAANNFQSDAISIWDGSQYRIWSTTPMANDAQAQFLSPYEAFFVRANVAFSGTFSIPTSTRASSPPAGGTYVVWKTLQDSVARDNLGISLTVSGEGKNARTYIGQSNEATAAFDNGPDMPFQLPLASVPSFYSLDSDGVPMRINKVDSVHRKAVVLGFRFARVATFTVHADDFAFPNGVHAELYDRHAGLSVRIDKEDYTFAHDPAVQIERFELHFKGNTRNF